MSESPSCGDSIKPDWHQFLIVLWLGSFHWKIMIVHCWAGSSAHRGRQTPLLTFACGLLCFDYPVFPLGPRCFSFALSAVWSPTSYHGLTTSPFISNKYLNSWRDKPDNRHIVEWDMSSLTGTFISMDRFSDTWHFLTALQGRWRYAESHCFHQLGSRALKRRIEEVNENRNTPFNPLSSSSALCSHTAWIF